LLRTTGTAAIISTSNRHARSRQQLHTTKPLLRKRESRKLLLSQPPDHKSPTTSQKGHLRPALIQVQQVPSPNVKSRQRTAKIIQKTISDRWQEHPSIRTKRVITCLTALHSKWGMVSRPSKEGATVEYSIGRQALPRRRVDSTQTLLSWASTTTSECNRYDLAYPTHRHPASLPGATSSGSRHYRTWRHSYLNIIEDPTKYQQIRTQLQIADRQGARRPPQPQEIPRPRGRVRLGQGRWSCPRPVLKGKIEGATMPLRQKGKRGPLSGVGKVRRVWQTE